MPPASSTTPAGLPPAGSSVKAAYRRTGGAKPGRLVRAQYEVEQARVAPLDVLAPQRGVPRATAQLLLDQARLAQHLEVVAGGRLRDRQAQRPPGAAFLPRGTRPPDLQPHRVAQGREHVGERNLGDGRCSHAWSIDDSHRTV